MMKHIAFSLPAALEITPENFATAVGVSLGDFRTWNGGADDVGEEVADRINDYVEKQFGHSSVMYAFAKPFAACGFSNVDDDSNPDEALSFIHERLSEISLLITEDGIELVDNRNGIQVAGIYDFSEWQIVRDLLIECEKYAEGDFNRYISRWKAALKD